MSNNDQIGIKAITNNNTEAPQSFSSFQNRIKLFDKAKSSQLDTEAKAVQFQHSKNYNKFQSDNNNSSQTKELKLSSNVNDIKGISTINEEDEKRNSFIKSRSVTISANSIKQSQNSRAINANQIPSVIPSKKIINKANTIIPSNDTSNDKINDLFLPQIEINESVMNNSLCEGFFISSFPTENAKPLENTESFPSTCGHQTCSSLIAMQPEILYRYPSKDSKTLELNNLAASICFPTGIKVCYEDEAEIPTTINYSSSITNQQGDRFYLVTYHFYHKILNSQFITKYQMYPIKYYTMKFCNEFYEKIEDDHKLQKAISKKLEEYSELNFREVVHIPFCICLISKYPYIDQMEKCLESIRASISNYKSTNKEVHRLITHIVKEIPIPPIGHEIKFTLPFINDFISITNPLINDFSYLDKNTLTIFNLFSIDNIVLIFRLILFEQRIVFVDNEYDRLNKVTNGFIGLIYPLQWIHTYIPIMSNQMMKYLQSFLPFLNGMHESLFSTALPMIKASENGLFIVYSHLNKVEPNSVLKEKKTKYKIKEAIPELPSEIEKLLRTELSMIKDKIDKLQLNDEDGKKEILIMIKNAFFQSMIEMFYDYMNYLSVIDGYPIFNINTLIENRPSKDARFYKEISETQMFLMFIQNMINDEQSSIFNSKIKQYHFPKDLLKKYNAINRDFQNYYLSQTKIIKESLIKPFFLNIDSLTGNDLKNEILTLSNKKYPFPEQKNNSNGILDEKCRITGNLLMLDQKENLPTYFYNTIPELEINTKIVQKANKVLAKADIFEKRQKKNKNKHNYILVKGKRVWELTEEEKEDIRDNIKDILSRALKSEKLQVLDDMKHLMELIDKNFGREFFINSIYQKSKVPTQTLKIISDDCFEMLSPVIFNGLLGILKLEENVQNYKNAILLIKATMLYYRVENKRKIFISEEILPKLKDYSLLVKYSFWEEWINLTVEETCDSERIKKDVTLYEHNIHKIILEITILMIQIGLVKDAIFKIITDLAENKISNKDLLRSLNSQIERLILSK